MSNAALMPGRGGTEGEPPSHERRGFDVTVRRRQTPFFTAPWNDAPPVTGNRLHVTGNSVNRSTAELRNHHIEDSDAG